MIQAILPVPFRVHLPGSKLMGAKRESYWKQGLDRYEIEYGRDLIVPPLAFYKMYSIWDQYLIEHTFISDHTLTPDMLTIHRDIYTGGVVPTPPVLVPISVTYGSPGKITETYLFTKSIDYLLTNYRVGYPLSLSESVILPGSHPITEPGADRMVLTPYHGVCGVVEYIDTLLQTALSLQLDQDYTRWTPPALEYGLRHRLTPERPEVITNTMMDIVQYEQYPDALFDFIDNTVGISMSDDPRTILTEFLYRGPYDPVTTVCLDTPSCFSLDRLFPYIDHSRIKGYYQIACSEALASESYDCLCLLEHINGIFQELELESLLEFFYGSSYTDLTIELNGPTELPKIVMYDRFGLYQYKDERGVRHDEITYNSLADHLKHLFMDHRWASPYNQIVMSKTWLGELFITGIRQTGNNSYCTKYYLNLNLYHLVSPSLINLERLQMFNM